MALQEGRIVCKRPETIVPLGTLTSAPTVKRTLFGTTLTIRGEDGCTYRLKGARYDTAKSFSTAVKNAWTDYHTRLLQAEWANLETLLSAIRALAVPVEYPAACTLSPMLERARMLNQRLLSKLPEEAIEPDIRESITMIQSFIQNASKMRQEAVAKFEDHQLSAWSRLFDTFESHPLTREQRRAIVTDEDATLVLAGAGSGKTSVITAKAGYLLQSGTRKPNEILILAFARDAAREMSDGTMELTTAPFVDRTTYLKQMEWKRRVHNQQGTTLVKPTAMNVRKGVFWRLWQKRSRRMKNGSLAHPRPCSTGLSN